MTGIAPLLLLVVVFVVARPRTVTAVTVTQEEELKLSNTASGGSLTVSVNGDSSILSAGSLSLTATEGIRLHSNGTWYSTRPSQGEATLLMLNSTKTTGSDAIGSFSQIAQFWSDQDHRLLVRVAYTLYNDQAALTYDMDFPFGAMGTNVVTRNCTAAPCPAMPCTTFPTVSLQSGLPSTAAVLTWKSTMCPSATAESLASADLGDIDAGPVVLYNNHSTDTVVVSPMTNFMVADHAVDEKAGTWSHGLGGELLEIPPATRHRTLVVYGGRGITSALDSWGSVLRSFYNTTRMADADITVNQLGTWTDNGAYYYFFRYPPKDKNEPEQALLGLDAYYKDINLPIQYYQLDAWWYACDGWNACIQNLTVHPDYFQHSLSELQTMLGGKPFDLYHNYFCPENNYTTFDFVSDDMHRFVQVLPDQSHKFYTAVLQQGIAQGMKAFELDYQVTTYAGVSLFRRDIHAARQWLQGMATAGEELSIPIQYCMSTPRYALQSLEFPAVTNARASGDFESDHNNLVNVGPTSLLYWPLRLRPSKDNFWTTGPKQPGRPEIHPYPAIHAVVAALSTGPVGISDRINQTNVTLVRPSCDDGGRLLQPSKPLTAVDSTYALDPAHAAPGLVWTTSMQHGNTFTHAVLAFFQTAPYVLRRSDLFPQPSSDIAFVVRKFTFSSCNGTACPTAYWPANASTGPMVPLESQRPSVADACNQAKTSTDQVGGVLAGKQLNNVTQAQCCEACVNNPTCQLWIYQPSMGNCWPVRGSTGTKAAKDRTYGAVRQFNDTDSYHLVTIAPVVAGSALLGEPTKYAAVSPQRFSNIVNAPSRVEADLTGSPNEQIHVEAAFVSQQGKNSPPSIHVVTSVATLDEHGRGHVVLTL